MASAQFRNKPERFIAYRDSLLKTHRVSEESVREYLDRYKNQPEKYQDFAKLVKQYVDSLSDLEMGGIQVDTVNSAVASGDSA